jgi:hypothetical protein
MIRPRIDREAEAADEKALIGGARANARQRRLRQEVKLGQAARAIWR